MSAVKIKPRLHTRDNVDTKLESVNRLRLLYLRVFLRSFIHTAPDLQSERSLKELWVGEVDVNRCQWLCLMLFNLFCYLSLYMAFYMINVILVTVLLAY